MVEAKASEVSVRSGRSRSSARQSPGGPSPRPRRTAGGTGPEAGEGLPEAALESLRAAVLHLFGREDPFERVGLRAISRRSGLSVSTLYKFAPSKEALIPESLSADTDGLLASLAEASRREVGARRRLAACLHTFTAYYAARPDLARLIFVNTPAEIWGPGRDGLTREQRAVFGEIVRHGLREGAIRRDESPDLLLDLACGAMSRFMRHELDASIPGRDAPAGARLFDLIWPVIAA